LDRGPRRETVRHCGLDASDYSSRMCSNRMSALVRREYACSINLQGIRIIQPKKPKKNSRVKTRRCLTYFLSERSLISPDSFRFSLFLFFFFQRLYKIRSIFIAPCAMVSLIVETISLPHDTVGHFYHKSVTWQSYCPNRVSVYESFF